MKLKLFIVLLGLTFQIYSGFKPNSYQGRYNDHAKPQHRKGSISNDHIYRQRFAQEGIQFALGSGSTYGEMRNSVLGLQTAEFYPPVIADGTITFGSLMNPINVTMNNNLNSNNIILSSSSPIQTQGVVGFTTFYDSAFSVTSGSAPSFGTGATQSSGITIDGNVIIYGSLTLDPGTNLTINGYLYLYAGQDNYFTLNQNNIIVRGDIIFDGESGNSQNCGVTIQGFVSSSGNITLQNHNPLATGNLNTGNAVSIGGNAGALMIATGNIIITNNQSAPNQNVTCINLNACGMSAQGDIEVYQNTGDYVMEMVYSTIFAQGSICMSYNAATDAYSDSIAVFLLYGAITAQKSLNFQCNTGSFPLSFEYSSVNSVTDAIHCDNNTAGGGLSDTIAVYLYEASFVSQGAMTFDNNKSQSDTVSMYTSLCSTQDSFSCSGNNSYQSANKALDMTYSSITAQNDITIDSNSSGGYSLFFEYDSLASATGTISMDSNTNRSTPTQATIYMLSTAVVAQGDISASSNQGGSGIDITYSSVVSSAGSINFNNNMGDSLAGAGVGLEYASFQAANDISINNNSGYNYGALTANCSLDALNGNITCNGNMNGSANNNGAVYMIYTSAQAANITYSLNTGFSAAGGSNANGQAAVYIDAGCSLMAPTGTVTFESNTGGNGDGTGNGAPGVSINSAISAGSTSNLGGNGGTSGTGAAGVAYLTHNLCTPSGTTGCSFTGQIGLTQAQLTPTHTNGITFGTLGNPIDVTINNSTGSSNIVLSNSTSIVTTGTGALEIDTFFDSEFSITSGTMPNFTTTATVNTGVVIQGDVTIYGSLTLDASTSILTIMGNLTIYADQANYINLNGGALIVNGNIIFDGQSGNSKNYNLSLAGNIQAGGTVTIQNHNTPAATAVNLDIASLTSSGNITISNNTAGGSYTIQIEDASVRSTSGAISLNGNECNNSSGVVIYMDESTITAYGNLSCNSNTGTSEETIYPYYSQMTSRTGSLTIDSNTNSQTNSYTIYLVYSGLNAAAGISMSNNSGTDQIMYSEGATFIATGQSPSTSAAVCISSNSCSSTDSTAIELDFSPVVGFGDILMNKNSAGYYSVYVEYAPVVSATGSIQMNQNVTTNTASGYAVYPDIALFVAQNNIEINDNSSAYLGFYCSEGSCVALTGSLSMNGNVGTATSFSTYGIYIYYTNVYAPNLVSCNSNTGSYIGFYTEGCPIVSGVNDITINDNSGGTYGAYLGYGPLVANSITINGNIGNDAVNVNSSGGIAVYVDQSNPIVSTNGSVTFSSNIGGNGNGSGSGGIAVDINSIISATSDANAGGNGGASGLGGVGVVYLGQNLCTPSGQDSCSYTGPIPA